MSRPKGSKNKVTGTKKPSMRGNTNAKKKAVHLNFKKGKFFSLMPEDYRPLFELVIRNNRGASPEFLAMRLSQLVEALKK